MSAGTLNVADFPAVADSQASADTRDLDKAGRTLGSQFSFIATHPKLRGLWIGRTTSVIGDRMFAVGTVWIAWTLTHSSAGVACIILAESIPFVVWGFLQRHTRLRVGVRTLVRLDLVRLILLAALFFLPLTGALTKACAVLLVAGVAFSTAIFEPAFRSLIPELVPDKGRLAYASFDLGGRLARIAGPLLAAGITWLGSPSLLIAANAATFFISAFFLRRLGTNTVAAFSGRHDQPSPEISALSHPSHVLITANGLGTFTLIVWWLALPIAAGHHPHGATIYGLCIGISAGGGIIANLLLSRTPDKYEPLAMSALGWAVVAVCIGLLALNPGPIALLLLSFACGAALCAAALGFNFHAASLAMPLRNQLFQRDQLIMRTAGACGAAASGLLLQYQPHTVIVGAGIVLFFVAAWTRQSTAASASLNRVADNS